MTSKQSSGTHGSATRTTAPLHTPTDLKSNSTSEIAEALNPIVADGFLLYMKTKNFHWHLSGPHFRDYHLMLDEQAEQIFASLDPLAERVRKLGQRTLHSLAHVLRLATLSENDRDFVGPGEMLDELLEDNKRVAAAMRKAHKLCEDCDDPATASLLEIYLDETEKRIWFLFETGRQAERTGH